MLVKEFPNILRHGNHVGSMIFELQLQDKLCELDILWISRVPFPDLENMWRIMLDRYYTYFYAELSLCIGAQRKIV